MRYAVIGEVMIFDFCKDCEEYKEVNNEKQCYACWYHLFNDGDDTV